MRSLKWLMLVAFIAVSFGIPGRPAAAQMAPVAGTEGCSRGVSSAGALWMICIPADGWDGNLLVWAHGYTAFNEPLDFQHLSLPDGTSIPALVQQMGMAFATTSYRQNGLAILEGADDVRDLVALFPSVAGRAPNHVFMTGASEGGIVTTLLVEQSPELFSGGLALCAPIGDFRRQINYIGDFRVLFDYFFPGVLPGSPTSIPEELIAGWDQVYAPRVKQALAANPAAARQLIRVSRAAIDGGDPTSTEKTTLRLLWYNVFSTNDAISKLGGNPYGNLLRKYSGSSNDKRLNQRVQRFIADPAALQAMAPYETSGTLSLPLVTLHTSGDELIPAWHQDLYLQKAVVTGGGVLAQLPLSPRYGHCNFSGDDIAAAIFSLLLHVSYNEA